MATDQAETKREAPYFPPNDSDEWRSEGPVDMGWNPAALEGLIQYVEVKNSAGLIILSAGKIILERYWRGAGPHSAGDVASAQKSVTALLIGLAQEEGLLRIDDAVSQHLGPGWSNAPEAAESRITLRHLLTMTSGLDDHLNFEAEAGATWYYNTPAYHLLKALIERASRESIGSFSDRRLFRPIGLQDSKWQDRPAMLAPLGARARAAGETARPLTALIASTRDLARLGLLVLAGGAWAGGDVIADKAYLTAATRRSQDLNPSYGYLWWLGAEDGYVLPGRGRSGEGARVPAGPADLVCALGAGDKKIYVSPSLGLVVARHGEASGEAREQAFSSFDNEIWSRIMAAAPR